MSRFIKHIETDEEKVVKKLGTLFSDFNLDLESIGYYLSRALPFTIFERVMIAMDSADFYRAGGNIDKLDTESEYRA
jgi:hypothetical protein